jgi:predicted nuclease with TOPRIM domain
MDSIRIEARFIELQQEREALIRRSQEAQNFVNQAAQRLAEINGALGEFDMMLHPEKYPTMQSKEVRQPAPAATAEVTEKK